MRTHDEILNIAEGTSIFPPKYNNDQKALYLQEDDRGNFSLGPTESVKGQFDVTFETITEGNHKSDYIPFILNKHSSKEYFLMFYNFSDPSKPLIIQKLLRPGELARVSATYTRTEKTRGTKYMVCTQYEPFELLTYEFIEDTSGAETPKIGMTSIRSLYQSD